MNMIVRQTGDVVIVDVAGDITLYHSPELRKTLLELIKEKRTPRVVVNMTQVPYIDSAGIASLIEGLKASRDAKTRHADRRLSWPKARSAGFSRQPRRARRGYAAAGEWCNQPA